MERVAPGARVDRGLDDPARRAALAARGRVPPTGSMAVDMVIDIENTPGALAQVAAAISDAGVNIAAPPCIATGRRAQVHILVQHAEAARHALAISHVAISHER